MTISEKVAYLKGLADGMELEKETSKESKLIAKIIDVLEDVGLTVEDLEDELEAAAEEMEELSSNLDLLESVILSDEEDEENPFLDLDGEDFFEIECPSCGEDIVIDESVLDAGQVACPNCGDTFALGFDEEEEEKE